MKRLIWLMTTLGVAVFATVALAGGAGTLDPSFGTAGLAVTAVGPGAGDDFQNGIAVQPDGRVLVAGSSDMGAAAGGINFRVIRYTKRGDLDQAFGQGGFAHTSLAAASADGGELDIGEHIYEIRLQPDGRIVAAGFANEGDGSGGYNFGLARYKADGSLDTSFGGDGTVTTAVAPEDNVDVVQGLALQTDGKIVAGGAGRYDTENETADFAVARYNADGTLDAGFGDGGLVHTHLGFVAEVTELSVQADGKIVAGGQTCAAPSGASCDFVLVRYLADGSLDASFGAGGIVITPVAPGTRFDSAWDLVLQSDGRIVAAGAADSGTGAGRLDVGIARYNPDGSLDTSFGGDGTVVFPIGPGDFRDEAQSLAIDALGRIVLGGESGTRFSTADFALARLNPDGSLDGTFGNGGLVITATAPGTSPDAIFEVAVDKMGKITAAGECVQPTTGSDVCVARYKGAPDG